MTTTVRLFCMQCKMQSISLMCNEKCKQSSAESRAFVLTSEISTSFLYNHHPFNPPQHIVARAVLWTKYVPEHALMNHLFAVIVRRRFPPSISNWGDIKGRQPGKVIVELQFLHDSLGRWGQIHVTSWHVSSSCSTSTLSFVDLNSAFE